MNEPCSLYRAGHCPHWIAMNVAHANDAPPPVPATLLEVSDSGDIVVCVGGHEHALWNHQPRRLMEILSALGPTVEFQPNLRLMWVPSESGRYAFSLSPTGEAHVECRVS
jgi:hypothetical protein